VDKIPKNKFPEKPAIAKSDRGFFVGKINRPAVGQKNERKN
jgi:hypothetical protein